MRKKTIIIICICCALACAAFLLARTRRKTGPARSTSTAASGNTVSSASAHADSVRETESGGTESSAAYLTENTYGKPVYTMLKGLGLTRNDRKTKKIAESIQGALKENSIDPDNITDVAIYADEDAAATFRYGGEDYTLTFSYDANRDEYTAYLSKGNAADKSTDSIEAEAMESAAIQGLPDGGLEPFQMPETEFVQKLAGECRRYGIKYQSVSWNQSSETDSSYDVKLNLNDDPDQTVTVSLDKNTNIVSYVFG